MSSFPMMQKVKRTYNVYMQRRLFGLITAKFIRDHPFSAWAKCSEQLTFLTPGYALVCACTRGLEMLVFQKI